MILSNQIKCEACGDEPYSTHVHDFRHCKCGAVAVDGGMSYIRRVGRLECATDLSIDMPDDHVEMCLMAIEDAEDTDRNSLGILCSLVRALRDCGYDLNQQKE